MNSVFFAIFLSIMITWLFKTVIHPCPYLLESVHLNQRVSSLIYLDLIPSKISREHKRREATSSEPTDPFGRTCTHQLEPYNFWDEMLDYNPSRFRKTPDDEKENQAPFSENPVKSRVLDMCTFGSDVRI